MIPSNNGYASVQVLKAWKTTNKLFNSSTFYQNLDNLKSYRKIYLSSWCPVWRHLHRVGSTVLFSSWRRWLSNFCYYLEGDIWWRIWHADHWRWFAIQRKGHLRFLKEHHCSWCTSTSKFTDISCHDWFWFGWYTLEMQFKCLMWYTHRQAFR